MTILRRLVLGLALVALPGWMSQPAPVRSTPAARPSPQQLAWHDLELGMFIHLAPQTWQDSENDNLTTPLSAINPDRLDTDQWVRVAQSMGAKYIVFVAKHEGGFCWWQTRTTDFGVRNLAWREGKGDVVRDLADSCRTAGMKLGVYLSPQDRTHGIGVGGRAKDPTRQPAYEALFRRQLTELLSHYGAMIEVWFDGNLVFDVGDILAAHAPEAVVFQGPQASIRWVGNEDGVAPYPAWNAVRVPKAAPRWGDYTAADSDPDGNRWLPIECDARIRSTWFWRTDNERTLKPISRLMEMYYRSVGNGAVLLLNLTPDRTGAMPASDAARAAEFGAEIRRRLGTPLAETHGSGGEIVLSLAGPATVDHVVLMEDIREGERVRRYEVEARVDGSWKHIATGSAVGHKKIDRIEPQQADALRLRVVDSVGLPRIRSFAAYGSVAR
jgi:alpha-L-fucosidase